MSDHPQDESEQHNTPAPTGSTFVVSREQFDEIPACRARYILLYLAITAMHVGPKVVFVVTRIDPPYGFAPIFYAILIALHIPFYIYFFKAMRTLGYQIPLIILTLMVTTTPILGLLPMGFTDRKIADAWDKADDAHQKYRQRVMEEDGEVED